MLDNVKPGLSRGPAGGRPEAGPPLDRERASVQFPFPLAWKGRCPVFLLAGRGREIYLGAVAEWLRSGLQNRVDRFDSGPRLQSLIRRSSVGRTVDC